MKFSGSWVLFLVVGTAFLLLNFSCAEMAMAEQGEGMGMIATSKRLKETGYNRASGKKGNAGYVDVDDYHPIDPVPSSKASIKPGPIQHGTPLMPYIPRPSPPNQPKDGGST